MVNSINQINKKGILTSFSVEPVLRLQCSLVFGRRSAYKNPHPYPGQRILPHSAMRRICKLERRPERPMAAYSVFVVAYWQLLLQSRLSDSIEQYNEPPRLHRNFANRILWFKSTRRMPGEKVRGTPLKKWLERNVVWHSRYHIRAKVNIALVIRIFRTEGI